MFAPFTEQCQMCLIYAFNEKVEELNICSVFYVCTFENENIVGLMLKIHIKCIL